MQGGRLQCTRLRDKGKSVARFLPKERGEECRETPSPLYLERNLATLLPYLCSVLHCRRRGGGFSAGGYGTRGMQGRGVQCRRLRTRGMFSPPSEGRGMQGDVAHPFLP